MAQDYGEIPTGDDGTTSYIGVPDDYTSTRTTRKKTPVKTGGFGPKTYQSQETVKPRYVSGDEYGPAGQSPSAIARQQQAMVDAGILGKGFRLGIWDDKTSAAMRKLLGYANQWGVSADQALSRLASAPGGDEGEGRYGQTYTVKTADPARLRLETDDLAKSLLGRKLSEEERERYVQQAIMEDRAQQERGIASQKATSEPGAADQTLYETEIDPMARMEEELKRRYAGEYGAHEIAGAGAEFFNMLRGA
jgi:hypothetical protein